jgi:hypothetical protein
MGDSKKPKFIYNWPCAICAKMKNKLTRVGKMYICDDCIKKEKLEWLAK